jgi:hypothetical protein
MFFRIFCVFRGLIMRDDFQTIGTLLDDRWCEFFNRTAYIVDYRKNNNTAY